MSENKKEEEEEEECVVVSAEDVEEGEISDSGGSVEEISEKDFAKAAAEEEEETNTDHPPLHHHQTRVWTMQDLYKYHHHTTTTSSGNTNYQISNGLYNLAWAQAVNNKPLHHQYLLMNYNNNDPHNSNINTSSSSTSIVVVDNDNNNDDNVDSPPTTNNKADITKEDDNKVFIEVDDDEDEAEEVIEKEEGELEEGEIDLDSEFAGGPSGAAHHLVDVNSNNEMEKQLSFIHQHLQTHPSNDRYKSFAEICSTLQNLLDSLSKMPCDNSVSPKHALVQKAFAAIQNVNHLFVSMNQNQKKHNKGELSRLFAHITHQNHPLFSSEQMKEIEVILSSLDSLNMSLSTGDNVEGKEIATAECIEQNKSNDIATEDLTSLQKSELDSMSIDSSEQEDSHILDKSLKAGLVNFKSRGAMLPLLDLHKDHDADSLPSPTRETPPLFPSGKALTYGNGEVRPEWPVPRPAVDAHNPVVHCYETDTLKAFSTYQQKFGRNTFLVTNRLPSPTPSDDSDNGDGDTGGEISSSLTWPKVVNALTSSQTTVSSIPQVDICSGQGIMNAPNVFTSDCVTNSAVKSSVKSRDPRLRLANSNVLSMEQSVPYLNNEAVVMPLGEVTNSRKQKIIEESAFHGPALKRQRNDLLDFQAADNVKSVSGHVGWLDDRGTAGFQVTSTNHLVGDLGSQPWNSENVAVSSGTNSTAFCGTNMEAQCAPVTGASTTSSVNSLLKNIAVNPAAWLNIFQMGPQKNADPASVTNQPLGSNGVSRSLPSINSDIPNIPFPKQISAGTLQPPQTASSDESGKLRMKPRDPRRALQNNVSHKGGNLESGQAKIKNLTTQEIENFNVQKQDQLKKSISTQSSDPPDIASLFTKNLKNIANIMSVSQTTTSPSAVSQISSTKPIQVPSSSVGSKGVLQESSHQPSESSLPSEATAGPSQSQNTWGEVEHLFKGFDDRQKADIQKERARRLEEQNNMFAARKLCLVLDLDHTLLNSAKFSEIDPLHDELLRKKEEQDREKPQRHLFRFPHMGMWTKLRPGIWKFLEKASKLFEMHLYTMGNKLYATEMAKLLDPKGALFAGRVISKGDDGDISDGDDRVHKTKDLEGVLGMESAVVIIDDSLRVWPHNKLNLIVVERYIYFPCSRRQFGLPGPSLLEIDHDERSENGTLASSLGVIERIHQNFFSSKSLGEADVRNILAAEQHKILDGCRIVFSRVFPVGEANPHLHPLWQTAEQFGAVCTNQIDEQVTHVVANSMGTDKVNWALSTGRFVVHPGWVEASALLYRRASEQDFAIKS